MTVAPNVLGYLAEPGRFDEAVDEAGMLRSGWAAVAAALGELSPAAIAARQQQSDRLLDAEGAGHLVHELALERLADRLGSASGSYGEERNDVSGSRPWRLDPLPYLVDQASFAVLAAGATQRMRIIEALLADVHGERRLVADRTVPADKLFANPAYRPVGGAITVKRWLVHYAVDVVRDSAGAWRVVRDLTDAPSGLGDALLARSVSARLFPDALRAARVAAIHDHPAALRRALTNVAPPDRRSPRCIVLTPGPVDPTYVEHSYLATQLGFHLAESADLVMRQGRLWLRGLEGLEPIDTVYRRLTDAALDPLEGRTPRGQGVPGLVWGAMRRGISLANAYGCGVVEHDDIEPLLVATAHRTFGESLHLQPLDHEGMLGSAPVVGGRQSVGAGAVVLRLQLVGGADGITVMAGGVGRVLAAGDDPRRPTTDRVKDVWVTGAAPLVGASRPLRISTPPQVDFGSSVTKRAADALYWLGRSAERAEVAARALREVGAQVDRDPGLAGAGGWVHGASALLRAAQSVPALRHDSLPAAPDSIEAELRATAVVVADQLASVVQEAVSVREFLSTTTGRVLGRLARIRPLLVGDRPAADDVDVVLVDLAALAGLATESTVRGPAWRFLDLGRRLERALAVLGSVEAALGVRVDPDELQPLAEAALSANESLVAYRRRYRSDIALDAVIELLVRDDTNPRSLHYQLDRLREHAAALGWDDGLRLIEQSARSALAPIDTSAANGRRLSVDALVLAARAPLLELGEAIAARWFADPVNPLVMRGR